jgi:carbamoyl-phosphate synthase large subunit
LESNNNLGIQGTSKRNQNNGGILMKRILVTSAGGSPAVNFTRSLKTAPEDFYIIGVDADKYCLCRAEVDERYLVPKASDVRYIPIINEIIKETHPDMLHVQHSQEVPVISKHRDALNTRTFLPKHESVKICDDKVESFKCWEAAGLKVPRTLLIKSESDIKTAFDKFGGKVWLRAVSGSAGRGAAPATDPEWAKFWVTIHKGWGVFSAAEYLSPNSVIWQSIWKDGELIVAQGRKRLYWEFGNRLLSGVSGVTGAGLLVSDPVVDKIAQESVLAIDSHPSGIWGVDLTYDSGGVPNPTEINIGRFFTTHQFFTEAGLNMPYIYVKLGLGEESPAIPQRLNPLPSNLVWIRGVDFIPKLTTLEQVEMNEEKLHRRLQKLEQPKR